MAENLKSQVLPSDKFPIAWITQDNDLVGNAFGYRVHNSYMKKYSAKYFSFDYRSDIALHIVPADKFKYIPNKFNILFTMWEFLDIPKTYERALKEADMIVVPCSFCRDLFARYTTKPIYVCWEGVEAERFPFKERNFTQGGKFRFLWVGAPNPRKGYPIVLEATKVFEQIPNVEIYLKTTTHAVDRREILQRVFKNRSELRKSRPDYISELLYRLRQEKIYDGVANSVKKFGKHENIIFDTRILSKEELVDLYHSAHCFILPSFGEGWGLTLSEAMATGAPCISVDYTGCKDFFSDSVGYTLKYAFAEQELKNYDLTTRSYVPDTQDFVNQMFKVIMDYGEAKRKGLRASELIRNKFTWERSAKRLYEIIMMAKEQIRKVA